MPKFIVQVVLHDPKTPDSYTELDAAMVKAGFSQDLPSKKASYHLPAGSYWYEGDTSPSDLRERAAAAAGTTDEDFGIIAVRADGWSIMRLKKVEAAPQAPQG